MIAGIIGYAILSDTNNEVLDKDQIQTNLENYGGEDLGYTYVSSYVKKYGIGNIDIYKLNYIETQLENDFYRELPSEYDYPVRAVLNMIRSELDREYWNANQKEMVSPFDNTGAPEFKTDLFTLRSCDWCNGNEKPNFETNKLKISNNRINNGI